MSYAAVAKRLVRIFLWFTPIFFIPALMIATYMAVAGGVPNTCLRSQGDMFPGAGKARFGIPKQMYQLYHAASYKYKIDWSVVAAVGLTETTHWTDKSISSAGARGPMQFMPETWQTYKSASGDPPYDIDDPKDSVFAAAKNLADTGAAKGDWDRALFAYNPMRSYVLLVLERARRYGYPTGLYDKYRGSVDGGSFEKSSNDARASTFPLPKGQYKPYANDWGGARPQNVGSPSGNFHEGVDIMAKEGTPVIAAVSGRVVRSGWNTLGGWRVTVRDARGVEYYYAHMRDQPKLKVGDRVEVGNQVGRVGRTGEGPRGTKGGFPPHLHFGMYDRDKILKDSTRRVSGAINPYKYLKAWEDGAQVASEEEPECDKDEEEVEAASGDAKDLLANKNAAFSPHARRDLQHGFMADGKKMYVDPRLVRVLLTIAQDHKFQASPFSTGHDRNTTSGGVSNHYYGRAIDIQIIDGQAVSPGCGVCKKVWRSLQNLPKEIKPTEVGAPWYDPKWLASFTDGGHQNHLHVGFDDPPPRS